MIRLPVIEGTLERRILLNYNFDPEFLGKLVPAPFELREHNGRGIGGVCLIRFRALRPAGLPAFFGIDSENAAHRVAVKWSLNGEDKNGVFIPRRDTASKLNYWMGGSVFPGVFNLTHFQVEESGGHYKVGISELGKEPHVFVEAKEATSLPPTSCFSSIDEASEFFCKGAIGYSRSRDNSHLQGMELRLLEWQIVPLAVDYAFVRLFEDTALFPPGSAVFDSALVMKNLRHEWHCIDNINCHSQKC